MIPCKNILKWTSSSLPTHFKCMTTFATPYRICSSIFSSIYLWIDIWQKNLSTSSLCNKFIFFVMGSPFMWSTSGNEASGRSGNPEGGGIISNPLPPYGWEKVNWSAKIWEPRPLTVCSIGVKVVFLCARQYMSWNIFLIKVLNNLWYSKHQIPTRSCSEAYL